MNIGDLKLTDDLFCISRLMNEDAVWSLINLYAKEGRGPAEVVYAKFLGELRNGPFDECRLRPGACHQRKGAEQPCYFRDGA